MIDYENNHRYTIVRNVLNNYAQDSPLKNRIGIIGGLQINNFDYGKFGFEFQHALNNRLYLNFTGTYDNISRENLMTDQLVYESSDLRIQRTQGQWDRLFAIRGGLDFEPNKHLSFGSNLVIGYNKSSTGIYDSGSAYSLETNTWEECYECKYTYHGIKREQDNGSINFTKNPFSGLLGRVNYLVYGLSLNIGVRIPFLNRWEIGAFYAPELTRNSLLNSKILYQGTDRFVDEFNSFTRFQHYIDVKLRFKI